MSDVTTNTSAAALNAPPKLAFEKLTVDAVLEMRTRASFAAEAKGVERSEDRREMEAAEWLSYLQAFAAPVAPAWQPIATAPRDRTPILVCFKAKLAHIRPDLTKWEGKRCVVNHTGLLADGFDLGWGVDAPVGYGGIPDEWLEGWQPLPAGTEAQGGAE